MKDLLKRWAELEPGQCQLSGFEIYTIAGRGICADFTYSYAGTYIYERELVLAWVEYAVQQAIVARGWYFNVGYLPLRKTDDKYHADVQVIGAELHSSKSDNLAVALLSAYLQALEAGLKGD